MTPRAWLTLPSSAEKLVMVSLWLKQSEERVSFRFSKRTLKLDQLLTYFENEVIFSPCYKGAT